MIVDLQTRRSRAKPSTPSENDKALEITGRDYISYSSISSYQRCPLKYYFSYIAGISPEFISSSLIFGSSIHSALEHYCRQAMEGAHLPIIDELVGAYEQAWSDNATAPVKYGKTETKESLLDLARNMLTAFCESKVFNLNTSILGIEEELRESTIPGCPDLLGRIDLITVDDEYLKITDFKTSRSRWTQAKVAESTPQLSLYADLAKSLATGFNNRPIRLEWIVLTKTKSPVVEVHSIVPNPVQLTRTKRVISRVWSAIKSGCFYPSPSAMNCSGCSFARACKQWEG